MKTYECTSCKKQVVVNQQKSNIELKCCKGDSPVKFVEVGTRTIIPVTKLPKAMENKNPLPMSTPVQHSEKTSHVIDDSTKSSSIIKK